LKKGEKEIKKQKFFFFFGGGGIFCKRIKNLKKSILQASFSYSVLPPTPSREKTVNFIATLQQNKFATFIQLYDMRTQIFYSLCVGKYNKIMFKFSAIYIYTYTYMPASMYTFLAHAHTY